MKENIKSLSSAGMRRTAVICGLIALWLILIAPRTFALPTFPPVVTDTYKPVAGGKIASALSGCTLCHGEAGPPLNAYGNDVKAALETAHTRMITPAILHSIDAKDSDGDGFTNAEEFAADTLPGDPNSHPASKPKAASSTASGATAPTEAKKPTSLFDTIRGLMLPKHMQHPVLVHFPIGLFIISFLFDLIALRTKERNFALAAYYNLVVAAIGSVLSVGSGLLAWYFAFNAAAFKGDLLYHLILGVTTMVMLFVLLGIRMKQKDRGEIQGGLYLALALIAVLLISLTGHLGGNLSGING